jgi:hypothetical protein
MDQKKLKKEQGLCLGGMLIMEFAEEPGAETILL